MPIPGAGAAGRVAVSALALASALTAATAVAQTPDAPAAPAQASSRPGPFTVTRAETAPVIDGVLDDPAWAAPPIPTDGGWRSYSPLNGDTIPQQTTVWVTADDHALYFAFRCDDPEPAGVKTSITRRDNIFADDWVGLSLDALGTGQTAYHLMVNPSGIQLDMINTVSGNEDVSPDWVWQSAGRLTPTGYAVEIRVPLQMLRFRGGTDVRMGVLFWRRVSRLGVSVAWPAIDAGRWVFDAHASLRFDELRGVNVRELIPSITTLRTEAREDTPAWRRDTTTDFGVSGKWGLSSTVTVEATLNPDFSQVESDAVQVEVNQRFPIFFSEKRPFFMEGAGAFNLAGNAEGDASMLYAVHTRRIVDPVFGAKLTGSAGRVSFASLTAVDQAPGRAREPDDPLRGRDKFWQVGRAQISLAPGSNAGILTTYTSLAGRTNTTVGGDLNLRIGQVQRLNAFVIGTWTEGDGRGGRRGLGTQINYGARTQRVGVQAQIEHYDSDFEMDTAFINRTGLTNGWLYSGLFFYPDKARYPWFRRVEAFSFLQGGRDRKNQANETLALLGVRMAFTRQGALRIDHYQATEAWRGVAYETDQTRVQTEWQVFRWLRAYANFRRGGAVYYDEVAPFQGDATSADGGVLLQPSGRLSHQVDVQRIAFDRRSSGERVYTVPLINTRTTYQFSRAIALRGLVRYDGQRKRWLSDLLASYEPRPGTVVFVGYGALHQRREWDPLDARWRGGVGEYQTTRRGLFFKASYLYRF